jgi:NAD+ kinase
MKRTIQTVGLFGKYQDQSVAGHLLRLNRFLAGRGLTVLVDESTARLLPEPVAASRPLGGICNEIDLAIVIGGDGTLLNVARALSSCIVPIIGVNLGRLGFLTDIAPDAMLEEIGRILDGDYQLERRLLLACEIMRKGRIVHSALAFNDVVITKGELARMIEFETYLDGEFVNSMRADGIIVASPTGSTAYALSAGGPLLDPSLPAIALVPVCPHTLSHRPLVVSSDSVVEVVLSGAPSQQAAASFDGQSSFHLADGDRVYVRRADNPVELIHPSRMRHYDVLREKLHWGKKH